MARADVIFGPPRSFGLPLLSGGYQAVMRPRIADLDGDGKPDLVAVDANCLESTCVGGAFYSTVTPILSDGQGGFKELQGVPSAAADAGAADVTGDPHPDLVATSPGSGYVNAWVPLPPGSFGEEFSGGGQAGLAGNSLALADFNGDGHPDEAVTSCSVSAGALQVALGNGTGAFPYFGAPDTYSVGSCPKDIAAGDLNGDDHPDLVVVSGSRASDPAPEHGVFVLLGKGDGSFNTPVNVDSGPTDPRSVALGDVDGDGTLDIAASDYAAGVASIYLGNGDGSFDGPLTADSGAGVISIASADFTADGGDVVVGYDANQVAGIDNAVGFVLGATSSAPVADAFDSGGSGARRVAAADFNGDGFSDLVVTHDGNAYVDVAMNVPDVVFSADSIAFPATTVSDSSATQDVQIENDGEPPLRIDRLTVGSDSKTGDDFQIVGDHCSGTTVPSGGHCDVSLRFAPRAAGAIRGDLFVYSNAAPWGLYPPFLDLSGTGVAAQATPTAAPAPATAPSPALTRPANALPPRIKGRAKFNARLTATRGTWSGSAPISFSYQWKSCTGRLSRGRASGCRRLRGATTSSLRLPRKSVGHRLEVVVTATNAAGRTSATSKPSGVVRK